jgi:hypothetical protein
MSELASGSPSFEEGFLCLEPHQFLFGAQTPLFCALKPRGVRRFLDIYFFSDGAKLCPQSSRFFAAYTRGQACAACRRSRLLPLDNDTDLTNASFAHYSRCAGGFSIYIWWI